MGMKGAEIIVDAALKEGMEYAFGLCGHGIIGLMDALHSRADRMKTISYGKSQPVDMGHNEIAWQKNRRDQFTIIEK